MFNLLVERISYFALPRVAKTYENKHLSVSEVLAVGRRGVSRKNRNGRHSAFFAMLHLESPSFSKISTKLRLTLGIVSEYPLLASTGITTPYARYLKFPT